ncbi:hypothetical protein TNCV_942251 [Trichonephila clavipes]|nr:hypothetical protein TNCV_942251 [Trichonephila clavipes]
MIPRRGNLFGTPLSKEFHPSVREIETNSKKLTSKFLGLLNNPPWPPITPPLSQIHSTKKYTITYKRIVHRKKKRKHINSFQSLNDAIHWNPSTIRELGHPVAPTGGEQVADACCKRKNCLPRKPY